MSKNKSGIKNMNNPVFFLRNTVVQLTSVVIVGVLLRLYYFPYDIPITLDALSYFFYANDTSILGTLPSAYKFPNNGWPLFVSVFFSLFHSNDFLDYMVLQRILTVSISVLTAIPVYFLCKRFVEKHYAIIGSAIFVFDPRIIQNSTLGETQPLFILFVAITLFLFLSNNMKNVYASFATAALLSIVRYEGLLLIIPISILYLIRFRTEKRIWLKFAIGVTIFLTIIAPISYLRMETTGQNGLTDQVTGGAVAANYLIQNETEGNAILFVGNGLANLLKYLGWVLIPIFVFFAPIGTVLFLLKRDSKTIFIVFVILVMLIPSLYAYSRDIQDTRYLYPIFPILCIFSAYTTRRFVSKFRSENTVLILIVCGIILVSIIFLEYKKTDYSHEIEAYEIAKRIDQTTNATNNFYPESKYVRVAELSNLDFPMLINGKVFGPTLIATEGYDSLDKFIENNRYLNLQHIITDDSGEKAEFLRYLHNNESNYPYLIKVFDSKDEGFNYHVKVFRIDYEKFVELRR